MERYKKNLKVEGNKVISYTTHVATIDYANNRLIRHGWWSMTTSKHINYVARELGLEIIEKPKEENPKEDDDKSLGLSALKAFLYLTNIDTEKDLTEEQLINRKARLFFATNGIEKPDNWEDLSLEEKKKRINKAENFL